MEDKLRNLCNNPKDARFSSLPASSNTNWFSNEDSNHLNVLKKGWLEKQSRNIFSPWKSKWVVLTQNGLSCYENEFENSSNSSHTLLTRKDITEVNNNDNYAVKTSDNYGISNNIESSSNNAKYIFKIFELNYDKRSLSSSVSSSSKKVDVYAAKSEMERNEWVKCLKKVMFSHIGGAIFGASLNETLYNERRTKTHKLIPDLVEMTCLFLVNHGLNVEGIFRHSCRAATLKKLREEFDHGHRPNLLLSSDNKINDDKDTTNKTSPNEMNNIYSRTNKTILDISASIRALNANSKKSYPVNKTSNNISTYSTLPNMTSTSSLSNNLSETASSPLTPQSQLPTAIVPTTSNIHALSSLLKAYLIELPEPIIPVPFYEDIMTIVTRSYKLDPANSITKISSILQEIPHNSYNLLSYMCAFLRLIGDNEAFNRMSHHNLAKVFCNAVLQPEVDDPALLMGTADNRATALTILITNYHEVFVDKFKLKSIGRGGGEGGRDWKMKGDQFDFEMNCVEGDCVKLRQGKENEFDRLSNEYQNFRNTLKAEDSIELEAGGMDKIPGKEDTVDGVTSEEDEGNDDDERDDDDADLLDVYNNKLSGINNKTINNINLNDDKIKSHSTDDLLHYKDSIRSSGDLFTKVTNSLIKEGISVDTLVSAANNKRQCIIGSESYLNNNYIQGDLDASLEESLKHRKDISEDERRLRRDVLCSDHESYDGPCLIQLCHTLKQLLVTDHQRIVQLEKRSPPTIQTDIAQQ